MQGQRPARALQHYTSNFVLVNFAGTDGALWIADKGSGRCWVRRSRSHPPRYDAFAQNQYVPTDVDEVLTERESAAAPVMRKVIKSARAGVAPDLPLADKEDLCAFLFVQIVRAPRVKQWAEKLDSQALYEMLTDRLTSAADARHPERTFFRRMMEMPLEVGRVRPDAALPLLIGDEPCLARAQYAESDEQLGNGPFGVPDQVIMPVAKDVYVQLSLPDNFAGGFHELDIEYVKALNAQIVSKAQRFVAGPTKVSVMQGLSTL
ncbi:MAG: DUF4238 domain-containing protein [Gammaproteobacteria bacterium]|nr:DUF4238 domain-containing protein [Gammaproteobacteria bacterium]MDE0444757.1 DUF4238 domain-containing protein [Gammaproteobacteria bacterium]